MQPHFAQQQFKAACGSNTARGQTPPSRTCHSSMEPLRKVEVALETTSDGTAMLAHSARRAYTRQKARIIRCSAPGGDVQSRLKPSALFGLK